LRRINVLMVPAVLICLLASVPASAEPGFGLPVTGRKTVVISDRVGENQIRFVSTAPLEEIHGTASDVSGSLVFDPNDVTALTGVLTVSVKSMKTGIDRRDDHLYSDDWLDVAQFPDIVLELSGLMDATFSGGDGKSKGTVKGTAVGAFTLHGVTRELQAPFEATYLVGSEKTAKRAPGDLVVVKSSFKIALADFEVTGVRGMVGKKVGKVIDVDVSLFGSTALGQAGE
jgi:polyisoprenoid-binding protein YceI